MTCSNCGKVNDRLRKKDGLCPACLVASGEWKGSGGGKHYDVEQTIAEAIGRGARACKCGRLMSKNYGDKYQICSVCYSDLVLQYEIYERT